MELKDKNIVITGATGGIGREVSIELAKEGAKLLLISKSEDKLSNLLKELSGDGHECLKFDFRELDKVKELEKTIRNKCDTLDILINTAGVGIYKTIEEADYCEWDNSLLVNATVPFYLIKALLPALKKSNESVVLSVGSGMGKIPTAGRSLYCASKFALRGLSMSLAQEFKESNVHFIHIALGSTLTDFGPMTLQEKQKENLMGKAYFTPVWVAKKFVDIIKSGDYKDEIELYPSEYTGNKWWPSGGSSN